MPLISESRRLFYGWWIVVASFTIALYTGGMVFYGFTAIFEPIADDLSWSHTHISLAASLRGLEMGLLAPVMGILVDRWGARRLVFSGSILVAVGFILLSRTTSLGIFYGAFALIAVGMSMCAPTVLFSTIVNWFRKNVGVATGIVSCGFGFGGLMIPAIVKLIEAYSWRTTVLALAIGMLAIGPALSLVLRHRPEPYGYLPDGKDSIDARSDLSPTKAQVEDIEIDVKTALRSRTFWQLTLVGMCLAISAGAMITHVMPYLSSVSITRSTAALTATAIPLLSIVGRLGFGWLGDRYDRRRIAASGFAIMVIGLAIFQMVSQPASGLLVPFVITFGIGWGGLSAMRPALVRQFFGRGNFGKIHGFSVGIVMLGAIAGTFLPGLVFDTFGSYQSVWYAIAGVTIIGLIAVATVPPVHNKQPGDSGP
ncbi:MFS transporter [Chloroflexota bacterium]